MLTTISPIDGRYYKDVNELSGYFSEMALMRYRIMVEIEYLLALSYEKKIPELPELSQHEHALRSLYKQFSLHEAKRIKEIEKTANHDVKSVEYYIAEKLKEMSLTLCIPFVHFALTSEDVNNLSYTLMYKHALTRVYLPQLEAVMGAIDQFSHEHVDTPLLSLTHGQSATPTTVGKEFAVFTSRLKRQYVLLKNISYLGKLSGATGTWSAHTVAYPEMDWIRFTRKFVSSLSLEPNLLTTQIENHDALAQSYHCLHRINSILIDFCRDVWSYVSRGILAQKKKQGEVGSSTMPHKINPIQFENAEGNLGIANSYFSHLAHKLPISRMQRDLSDSTVLRNQGVPLAHAVLACKNIQKGMTRLTINETRLNAELDEHWEVLAEAIQTLLRKHGHLDAYEQLKKLTRGETITRDSIKQIVEGLDIPESEKQRLMNLSPHTYTGLASHLIAF